MMPIDDLLTSMTTHCEGFSNERNPPITRKFPTGSLYLRKDIITGVIIETVKYKRCSCL